MAKVLKIVQEGDPVLRKMAEPVKNPKNPEIKELIADMIATMNKVGGIGLAAPQIGAPFRIFTANVENKVYVFINPEIKNISQDESSLEEGCLSVQKVWGPVVRPKKLTVKALNQDGEPIKIRAKGLLARVIQHEIDHLNGTLFIDRAEKLYSVEGGSAPGEQNRIKI
ncbi:MAG: peptide deformylase [Patescibacteria group bacterium]